MIFDTKQHLATYRGISRHLDKAIDFLMACPWEALEDGPLDIDGQQVYATIMTVSHQETGPSWETHRKYVDIQISLTGTEIIGYMPASALKDWSEFEGDIRFAASKEMGTLLSMEKDRFAVFFPWDAHSPNRGTGQGRKLVMKVAWEE